MYEYRRLSPDERAELVQARLERGYPPHQPPHPEHDETLYLLTASCYEHRHHMANEQRRKEVLDLVFGGCIQQSIELLAWVVLPDHYHLLARIPDLAAVGTVLRHVHGPTAREWNLEDDAASRKVWYRYTDRAIRSMRHYYTTLNYIHYNPVKHGVAGTPYEWGCSSVSWYLETYGREWLRDVWQSYPVRDYGRGWDRS